MTKDDLRPAVMLLFERYRTRSHALVEDIAIIMGIDLAAPWATGELRELVHALALSPFVSTTKAENRPREYRFNPSGCDEARVMARSLARSLEQTPSFWVYFNDPQADERGDRALRVVATDHEDARTRFIVLTGNAYHVTRVETTLPKGT